VIPPAKAHGGHHQLVAPVNAVPIITKSVVSLSHSALFIAFFFASFFCRFVLIIDFTFVDHLLFSSSKTVISIKSPIPTLGSSWVVFFTFFG
jgi:hypothetical protein